MNADTNKICRIHFWIDSKIHKIAKQVEHPNLAGGPYMDFLLLVGITISALLTTSIFLCCYLLNNKARMMEGVPTRSLFCSDQAFLNVNNCSSHCRNGSKDLPSEIFSTSSEIDTVKPPYQIETGTQTVETDIIIARSKCLLRWTRSGKVYGFHL